MSGAPQQRYRVIERLASGGMAEVYLAESAGIEGFKKQVAIKRVLPHLSEKKRFIAMFLDEARLSAHLTHSNVAQVFDIGVGDNAYFIVMEYVNGADLKAVIDYMKKESRAFPVEAAVFIALKICEGLAYAHELTSGDGKPLRIVHRDMSPPNVLITKYGEVKIVDFGLAKATSQLEKSEAGIIKGKFSYLSPEAALGDEVDHRTDIFAVGIILWEMLSGRRLFLGESDFQTVKLVQAAKIPALAVDNPGVPAKLDRIIAKALARDPAQRYPSAHALCTELTNFLYELGRPVSAFNVAELVVGAMKLRKRVKPEGGVAIDRLIEEALVEFKSLQEDERSGIRESQPEPVKMSGGFENLTDWASEIGIGIGNPSEKSAGGGGGGIGLGGGWEPEVPAAPKSIKPAEPKMNISLLDVLDDVGKAPAPKPAPPAKEELSASELLSVSDIDVGKTTEVSVESSVVTEGSTITEGSVVEEVSVVVGRSADGSPLKVKKKKRRKREGAPRSEASVSLTKREVTSLAPVIKRPEPQPVAGQGSNVLKLILVAAAIIAAIIWASMAGLFSGPPKP